MWLVAENVVITVCCCAPQASGAEALVVEAVAVEAAATDQLLLSFLPFVSNVWLSCQQQLPLHWDTCAQHHML